MIPQHNISARFQVLVNFYSIYGDFSSGLQLESDPKPPSNFPKQPQPTTLPPSQTRQSTTSSNPQISQVVGASGEALVTATPTEISTGEPAVEASVTEAASGPSIANPSPSSAATAEREETQQDDSHLSIDDLIVFHPSFPGENPKAPNRR